MAVFAIGIVSFLYLSIYFFSYTIEIKSKEQFFQLENNVNVKIEGNPVNLKQHEEYITFTLNNISVRSSSKSISKNFSLVVEGYKSSYLNNSWIQATKIEYDN